jgi:hypothetical protein
MAGFEGADHRNGAGRPLHPNEANGHWQRLDEDYGALTRRGIRTVRESVGWRVFDEAGAAGERRLMQHAQVAAAHGLQVVWTLMHYGVPAGVDWHDGSFAERFARYCERVVRVLRRAGGPTPVYQPINEISFLAWAASETHLVHPHVPTSPAHGFALKRQLVGAALRGCDAIWSVVPDARIVHTDPVMHVVPPSNADELTRQAARHAREHQFQAWDMLCGRMAPELGGSPRYLDLIGINYYHSNQWEHGSNARLHWHLRDPRRLPFEALAREVWLRYERPLLVAETGHVGEGRAEWLDDVAASAARCRASGVPLEGICLYPAIDRPDWEDPLHWHQSGLWDLPGALQGDLTRVPDAPLQQRLLHWQHVLPGSPVHSHFNPTED